MRCGKLATIREKIKQKSTERSADVHANGGSCWWHSWNALLSFCLQCPYISMRIPMRIVDSSLYTTRLSLRIAQDSVPHWAWDREENIVEYLNSFLFYLGVCRIGGQILASCVVWQFHIPWMEWREGTEDKPIAYSVHCIVCVCLSWKFTVSDIGFHTFLPIAVTVYYIYPYVKYVCV